MPPAGFGLGIRRSRISGTLACAVILATCVFAQSAPDSFQVNYVANLAKGDSIINLTNAGSISGTDPAGDICANIYVLAPDQQLIECCSCPLTPNHLKSVSVVHDLAGNSVTPGFPDALTIALIASPGATCDPSAPAGLASGLRAWCTTVHAAPGGGSSVTERAFLPAAASAGEIGKLTGYCGFIRNNGSGYGICAKCEAGGTAETGGGGGIPQ